MTTIVQMTQHGIRDTASDFWTHFHPLHIIEFGNGVPNIQGAAFWYDVELCLNYIDDEKLEVIGGRSKDGNLSGAGYLVPKKAYFVHRVIVPRQYIDGLDWVAMSDRKCGMIGQDCIKDMIATNVIPIPQRTVERVSRSQEFESSDFKLYGKAQRIIEAKTERVISEKLFVQCGERGHNPNLVTGANGEIIEHYSQLR